MAFAEHTLQGVAVKQGLFVIACANGARR